MAGDAGSLTPRCSVTRISCMHRYDIWKDTCHKHHNHHHNQQPTTTTITPTPTPTPTPTTTHHTTTTTQRTATTATTTTQRTTNNAQQTTHNQQHKAYFPREPLFFCGTFHDGSQRAAHECCSAAHAATTALVVATRGGVDCCGPHVCAPQRTAPEDGQGREVVRGAPHGEVPEQPTLPPAPGQTGCLPCLDSRSGICGTQWSSSPPSRWSKCPRFLFRTGVPWRAVLREPQVVEQLVDVPVPSFCEFELVSEEAEEDYEGEEEEELEMFDETTNRLELQLAPPAPMPPLHGGPLRRRVGLHVRARRTRAPPVYPSCSRTWTCQCRRSRLSSRRRSWSSWWMCQRHRSWESWQLCRPHHRGACRRKFFR